MLQSKFLQNKIKRQISLNGIQATFKRYEEDEYHQIVEDNFEEITFKCIFHTTNTFVKSTVGEAAKTVSKPQPMILCLFEDGEKIQINDKIEIGTDEYIVTDKNNINGFNIAYDISLEQIK